VKDDGNLVMIFLVWMVYHGAEIFAPDASISKTIMATQLGGIKRLVELISRYITE
jgi:hypothetical protein